jgi:hypothetical protein
LGVPCPQGKNDQWEKTLNGTHPKIDSLNFGYIHGHIQKLLKIIIFIIHQ